VTSFRLSLFPSASINCPRAIDRGRGEIHRTENRLEQEQFRMDVEGDGSSAKGRKRAQNADSGRMGMWLRLNKRMGIKRPECDRGEAQGLL